MKRIMMVFGLGLVGFSLYAETFTVTGLFPSRASPHPIPVVSFWSKADQYASEIRRAEEEMREPDHSTTDLLLAGSPGNILIRFEGDTLEEAKASNWLVIVRDANGHEFVRERSTRSDPDYTKSRPYYWYDYGYYYLGGYGSDRDKTPIEWPLSVRLRSDKGMGVFDFSISREEEQGDKNE
jgi:hypothetical protein